MAIAIQDRHYLYSAREFMGGFKDRTKGIKMPDVQLISEDDFWKCVFILDGKREAVYVKKGTLKKFEIQAAYAEAFGDYRWNGHCYIRPSMSIDKGDIVVDAGGCEGFYSKYALRQGASKVIIFEPYQELASGLKKSFRKEIGEGRVLVIEKALGKRACEKPFFVNPKMICASSLVTKDDNATEKRVPVISLDECLAEFGISRVDIIKMDIEDGEVDAVLGGRKIIRNCHPKMIIATYHSYRNATKIRRICKKIDKEYRCKLYGCYQFVKPYRPYLTLMY